MKARVLFMAMAVAFTSFANAQEQKTQEQQNAQEPQAASKTELRAKKMAERLMLDDSKEAKFTPLYKEYLDAKATCRPQLVKEDDLTDAQIEANIEAMLDVREKSLELDKKYYKKLSKVLNAKQLDMIFGFNAQMGKRPMAHGKDMKGMPARHFGKPGSQKGNFPKEFMKGGQCKKNEACKNECKNECKEQCKEQCKKDCPKAADCKKECKK